MIHLKRPGILFLKPLKVAGTSFEIALSRYAGPDDIITPIVAADEQKRSELKFAGPRNYRYTLSDLLRGEVGRRAPVKAVYDRAFPMKYFNHIPLGQVRKLLGETVFSECLKVSIVRNPYDQLVSMYHWRNGRNADPAAFRTWLAGRPGRINENLAYYLVSGEWKIDHCIRFESFREDILALEELRPELSGLWDTFSGITTKGGVRPPRKSLSDYYRDDAKLLGAVEFFNAAVIERFQYDFPS